MLSPNEYDEMNALKDCYKELYNLCIDNLVMRMIWIRINELEEKYVLEKK